MCMPTSRIYCECLCVEFNAKGKDKVKVNINCYITHVGDQGGKLKEPFDHV